MYLQCWSEQINEKNQIQVEIIVLLLSSLKDFSHWAFWEFEVEYADSPAVKYIWQKIEMKKVKDRDR